MTAVSLLTAPTMAVADGPNYQTKNGVQTFISMGDQLKAIGYGGPWDSCSVVTAYGQATGSAVSNMDGSTPCSSSVQSTVPLSATPASQPAASQRGVLLVAGAASQWGKLPFGPLQTALEGRGVSPNDIWYFSYDGFRQSGNTLTPVPYTWTDPCQDLSTSEQRLHDYIVAIVAGSTYRLSVVGHSLGGVIALDTLMQYPDIQPLVRSVVTIDSPVMGIGPNRESAWLGHENLSYCTAMDELVPRSLAGSATLARLRAGAQQLLIRGTNVVTIVNDDDNLYSLTGNVPDQGINGVPVNVENGWTDGTWSNHDAVLTSPSGIATILQEIL